MEFLVSEKARTRFFAKVDKSGPNGCWLWSGGNRGKGYGQFFHLGNDYAAHRFSWEMANEQKIPAGLLACHRCDNRRCVNPEHIFLGTNADNIKDAYDKGRITVPDGNRERRATCMRGHPLTGENVYYFGPNRGRTCKKCKSASDAKRRKSSVGSGITDA